MSWRLTLVLAILGTGSGRASAQPGALDLIPSNAAAEEQENVLAWVKRYVNVKVNCHEPSACRNGG